MKTRVSVFFALILLVACNAAPGERTLPTITTTKMHVPTYTITIKAMKTSMVSPTFTSSPTETSTLTTTLSLAETATPTITPRPTQVIPSSRVKGYCGNVYWPIVEGATWKFSGTRIRHTESGATTTPAFLTDSWTITKLDGYFPYPANFILRWGNTDYQYYCDENGIYTIGDNGREDMLPSEELIATWYTALHRVWFIQVDSITAVNIPLGTFNAIQIDIAPWGEDFFLFYYAPGIGPIQYKWNCCVGTYGEDVEYHLVEYSITRAVVGTP